MKTADMKKRKDRYEKGANMHESILDAHDLSMKSNVCLTETQLFLTFFVDIKIIHRNAVLASYVQPFSACTALNFIKEKKLIFKISSIELDNIESRIKKRKIN